MELILHLGAHRTGTSALQMACRKNRELLVENRMAFWGPDMLRDKALSGFANQWSRAKSPETDPELAQTIEMMHAAISQQAQNARVLVISEENMIGAMVGNFKNLELYGNARKKLTGHAALFPTPPTRIFLCLRDYASYWASSYAFAASRNDLPPFDDIAPTLIKCKRGWCDVIADIRAVFPESELIISQHEISDQSARRTLSEMFDTIVEKMKFPAEVVNASFSAPAVALAQQMRRENPDIEFKEIRDAVGPLNTPDAPIFKPFSPAQTEALAERYRDDTAAIAGMCGKYLAFSPTSDAQTGSGG